jgi:hypothetical protein
MNPFQVANALPWERICPQVGCHRTSRSRLKPLPRGRWLCAWLCLSLAGCGWFAPETPRRAWERSLKAEMARDYEALWGMLSDHSKRDIETTLSRIKGDPGYQFTMSQRFLLKADAFQTMTPKAFYITMLEQAEQVAPELVQEQLRNARQATFVREEINRDRAVVYWRNERGVESASLFIREDGRWRTVLNR